MNKLTHSTVVNDFRKMLYCSTLESLCFQSGPYICMCDFVLMLVGIINLSL